MTSSLSPQISLRFRKWLLYASDRFFSAGGEGELGIFQTVTGRLRTAIIGVATLLGETLSRS